MVHARRAVLAIPLALSLLAAGGASVAAHALLASSSPAANAVLATAPTSVTLTFTEPPDPRLSSAHVLDASGADHATGPAVPGGDANTLTVSLGPLPDGVYTVTWRTVSAADGHATAGSFAFSVGTGAPPASASSPPGGGVAGVGSPAAGASTVSLASVLARLLFYLGLIVLLGSLVAGQAVLAGDAPRQRPLRAAAWALALGAALALYLAQAADAGVPPVEALASSLGADALGRAAPLVLAGGAMALAARSAGSRRAALGAAIGLAALGLLADAAASHAATAVAPPLAIALQWLHGLGVAVWLGGLGGLLVELPSRAPPVRARLLSGFSRWATIGIVVVGLTGIARAAFELDSLGQLISTVYGQLLLVKLALFAGLALLGALNHFRNVPGGSAQAEAAQRAGSLELLLGATAVVVATLLVTTPPPSGAGSGLGSAAAPPGPGAPITASPVTVSGSDYAATVKVRLTISPGTPGPSTFAAAVVDPGTGSPAGASAVKLRFALPSRPDVGASSLVLTRAADGSFGGTGSNLGLTGLWAVTAVVTTRSGAVEVPLVVPMASPSGPVTVNRVVGQPTIFAVPLPGGRQAQLYIEPSTVGGPSTLHITYFDQAGRELPVTGIKAEAAWSGAGPSPLLMSPIEPGHATAKLQPPAGQAIVVVVTGAGPDGAAIAFSLTIPADR